MCHQLLMGHTSHNHSDLHEQTPWKMLLIIGQPCVGMVGGAVEMADLTVDQL